MGVISVSNVFSAEYWSSEKPADYKGTELEKALQVWGGLANKTVDIPKDLIPAPPECKVGTLTKYVEDLKSVLKELDTAKVLVNQYISALKAVQGAGGKAASDLTKMANDKHIDEATRQKYTNAASAANSIAGAAGGTLKKYE
jgi:hypothetical protein